MVANSTSPFLRQHEVTFISCCFEYWQQEGDFQVKATPDIFVKFYSGRNSCEIILAPDYVKEIESKGVMIIKESEALKRIRVKECKGEDYRASLERLRGSSNSISGRS